MLLFRSEDHVSRWCRRRGLTQNPTVTLSQLWELATAWYANRLSQDARRPMGDEIRQIFDRVGLDDPFWKI
jgi:hypothetical protein